MDKRTPTGSHRQSEPRHPALLALLLLGGLLALSACRGNTGSGNQTSTLANHKSTAPIPINGSLLQQGQSQIQTFQLWIGLLQQFHGDSSKYQQQYTDAQKALATSNNDTAYQAELQKLGEQIEAIKIPAMQNEASTLTLKLNQEAKAWGAQHTFRDSYNGTTYPLAYEYGSNGVAGWSQDDLASAKTMADYQQVIEETNMFLNSFEEYKQNVSDHTSWNRAHKSDLALLKHYGYNRGKVVVVSLSEQAMRIYNNGKLVNAFQVTTGRPEKPSPPGAWQVENKQAPTVFKSDEPQGSPYWYPDTPIHYAMLYHSGGYFIHDSWWRSDYGPDTQFPHVDSSGDSFSYDGSHGCVNISITNAAWVYNYVDMNTNIIIY